MCIILVMTFTGGLAQTRLVLNGAKINLTQGAYLVIENSAANAISRNSGHIITESENNRIKWNIGTAIGTYIVPLGYGNTDYIPLTFTKTAGSGIGYFLFSTYHTTWNNISQLPTGVMNVNGASGTDNSAYLSDRFWQVNALGYSTKPALTNLQFTYLDNENSGPNTITEVGLRAKRYNNTANSWIDNLLSSSLNTTTKTLTVASVDIANLQSWWMLGNLNANRYWVAPSNSNASIPENWSENAGGPGNAGVPTAGDAIVFDGSSDFNCALNSTLTGSSLLVSAGFLGTITQGTNSITINNNATFSGGVFSGGSSDITVNGNLTISGTAFTAPSTSLHIKGDLNITSGSFLNNDGTVTFSGANGTTQNISSSAPTTFHNITVTNATSPGVSVQNNQNLKGVLTLASNVNFDADGSSNNSVFKLLSTGDNLPQDAAIAALPSGAQVSGNVTVQRFMTKEGPNNNRIYRYISSAVQNASVADLQQEIPVTGVFTGTSVCTGCLANQSMFAYNETVTTDTDGNGTLNEHDGFIDFPDMVNSETFQPGKGYALFVRANILSSTLWDLRGPINRGNVQPLDFPITYTSSASPVHDGWNLVGNPFPSTIDWNASSGWTKTNVDQTIYIADNGTAGALQFATWNGSVETNGGSRYVALGQAFWIKSNGSLPILQANENVKKAGTQAVFFREKTIENLLRITMVSGSIRDETVIHFRDDATPNFDSNADAYKLLNSSFNLSSSQSDGTKLAINSISLLDCRSEIGLNVENSLPGNYQLNFSEYESFSESTTINMQDAFTARIFDIRRGGSYDFSVTADSASYGRQRFRVTFASPPLNSDFVVSADDICEGSVAEIKIANSQEGVIYVVKSGVTIISNSTIGNGGTVSLLVPVTNVIAGQNSVSINAVRESCSAEIEKSLAFNVVKKSEITSAQGSKVCREGVMTLKAVGASINGFYNWYESESAQFPLPAQHDSVFTTPNLQKSKTYFVSAVNSLGCEGPRYSVIAQVIHFDDAHITPSGDLLQSNYSEGNQWYFNNKIMADDTTQFIKPMLSGIYTLTVNVDNCTTSTDYTMVITEAAIFEGTENTNFTVFPNPVRDEVYVTIPKRLIPAQEIRMISSIGQVIGNLEVQEVKGEWIAKFRMSDYPAGVYIVQVTTKMGVERVKLVKE
jgi:hypothetical protein